MTSSPDAPLVSCLMPTGDRRPFVPLAVERFLDQDHPALELVILDDGDEPVDDLVPRDPRIRYVRLRTRVSLGAKRNLACEMARGDVLCHWDDDDWYAPSRVAWQVRQLARTGADVCGLRQLLFWAPLQHRSWRYTYPEGQRPWVLGSSFCFSRAWWRTHAFPDVGTGEDTGWLWTGPGPRVVASTAPLVVALLHARNTSRTRPQGAWWRATPESEVAALLGRATERYRSAAAACAADRRSPG